MSADGEISDNEVRIRNGHAGVVSYALYHSGCNNAFGWTMDIVRNQFVEFLLADREIAGQLDRYARWAEIKAQSASAPPLKRPEPINGAPAGTLTGAAKIAQETYERQMGGIQSAVEAAMAGGWYGNA